MTLQPSYARRQSRALRQASAEWSRMYAASGGVERAMNAITTKQVHDVPVPAGFELDERIALLLGWEHTDDPAVDQRAPCWRNPATNETAWRSGDLPPQFSTDGNRALQVIEHLRGRGLLVNISTPLPGFRNWDVRGWNPETNQERFIAHGETFALAVCRAALEVLH